MSNQITPPPNGHEEKTPRERYILGIMLVAIGLVAFLGQFIKLPSLQLLILPLLAVIFLAWGLLTREFGLLIPGGVLAGVALGTYLAAGRFEGLGENNEGGVFLLAFSAGWVLLALLSPLTKQGFQWWPLIPGVILGLIGIALLTGGLAMQLLQVLGYAWPLILVAVGVYILVVRRNHPR